MRFIPLLLLTLAGALCRPAAADSWLPPKTERYLSSNGQWRLTVVPRGISSAVQYFEDATAGRANAGGKPGAPTQPHGVMERLAHGEWQPVWHGPLANKDAPASAVVSTQGWAATFDNWHSVGYGDDVVVVYDREGRKVRSLSLEDFLPADYIRALPHSISSIWWGQQHAFSADGRYLILRVVVPQSAETRRSNAKERALEFPLDLTSGQVQRPQAPAWDQAMEAARQVNDESDIRDADRYASAKAPLNAPVSEAAKAWERYLEAAFYRLSPSFSPDPRVGVLNAVDNEDEYEMSIQEALTEEIDDRRQTVLLGGADSQRLIQAISATVRTQPKGWLQGLRVYVAVTPAHQQAAELAMAPSGASFVWIDTTKPIYFSPKAMSERFPEAEKYERILKARAPP